MNLAGQRIVDVHAAQFHTVRAVLLFLDAYLRLTDGRSPSARRCLPHRATVRPPFRAGARLLVIRLFPLALSSPHLLPLPKILSRNNNESQTCSTFPQPHLSSHEDGWLKRTSFLIPRQMSRFKKEVEGYLPSI
jgi:hypothetical protein